MLYLHRFNSKTSLEETLETFAELKQSGKIRYVGIYNCSAWQGMDTINNARLFSLRIDFFQPMTSLVKRQAEVEILPMCAVNEITVTTYSPISGGLLTGNYLRGERGRLVTDIYNGLHYKLALMRNSAKNSAIWHIHCEQIQQNLPSPGCVRMPHSHHTNHLCL